MIVCLLHCVASARDRSWCAENPRGQPCTLFVSGCSASISTAKGLQLVQILEPARISKIQMATGEPPSPDTSSGTEAASVAPPEGHAKGGSLDHRALADRRVEIEKDEELKLHLKVWEDDKKGELRKIESYRGRCTAAMAELYQLLGFYSLFQGVVFSAVSNRKLSCPNAISPFLLSLLTSIATAVSIHYKLTFYETEKLKFIRAEWDVNNLIKKINKLTGQGKDFKFEEIEDPNSDSKKKAKTLKLTDAMKVHRRFYKAAMFFLLLFSCIILISCFVVLCAQQERCERPL